MAGQHSGTLEFQGMSSCAISEISGVLGYEHHMDDLIRDFNNKNVYGRTCQVVFHGPTNESIGKDSGWLGDGQYINQLVAFIREHKLGEVTLSHKADNVQAHKGHMIRVGVWAPDYEAIKAWVAANPKEKKVTKKRVVLKEEK